ncbi:MAG: hypothetical protein ACJ713_08070 [Candidatus Sulfotelmatobacter sp.]
MSLLQRVLAVVLLLQFFSFTLAQGPQEGVKQNSASVTINPREVTIHVGKTQTFEAVVKGTRSTGIRWAIAEDNGGSITEDGIYTAPHHIGLYHVVATSEENPAARALAKVTVVTETDPYDYQPK